MVKRRLQWQLTVVMLWLELVQLLLLLLLSIAVQIQVRVIVGVIAQVIGQGELCTDFVVRLRGSSVCVRQRQRQGKCKLK